MGPVDGMFELMLRNLSSKEENLGDGSVKAGWRKIYKKAHELVLNKDSGQWLGCRYLEESRYGESVVSARESTLYLARVL